jgi:CheY-like chemotaxis protein
MTERLALIVDDVPSIRTYLRVLLQRAGFAVLEASDGREGLDRVHSVGGALDLLVTDVQMPVMDGLALAAAVRADFPRIPIILVSGYAGGVETDLPMVRKPFGRETLLAAIADTMAQCRAASA